MYPIDNSGEMDELYSLGITVNDFSAFSDKKLNETPAEITHPAAGFFSLFFRGWEAKKCWKKISSLSSV